MMLVDLLLITIRSAALGNTIVICLLLTIPWKKSIDLEAFGDQWESLAGGGEELPTSAWVAALVGVYLGVSVRKNIVTFAT